MTMKYPGKIIMLSVAALLAVALASCQKEEKNTYYTVKPYYTTASSNADTVSITSNATLFVHYISDADLWQVKDYTDACSGILTDTLTGNQRNPDLTVVQSADGTFGFGPVAVEDFIMVVYNADDYSTLDLDSALEPGQAYDSKMYAWRDANVAGGLDAVTVPVMFYPWKTDTVTYVSRKWNLRNDNPPVEKIKLYYLIKPYVQVAVGDEKQMITQSDSIAIYGHYGKITEWEVRDYAYATNGKFVFIEDNNEELADFKGTWYQNESCWSIGPVDNKDLMIVIADKKVGSTMYAVCQAPAMTDPKITRLVVGDLEFN